MFTLTIRWFHIRICPGRYLAEWNAWYLIANIIANFDIKRSVDAEGKEVVPPLEFTSGLARCVVSMTRMRDLLPLTPSRGQSPQTLHLHYHPALWEGSGIVIA